MKLCPKCERELLGRDFPNDTSKRSGHGSWCLECRSKRNREIYAERGRRDRPLPERLRQLVANGRSPASSLFDILRLRCPKCRCVENVPLFARDAGGRADAMAAFAWTCRGVRCGERWGVVVLGAVVEIVWLDLPAGERASVDQVILTWAGAREAAERLKRDVRFASGREVVPSYPLKQTARFVQDPGVRSSSTMNLPTTS